MSAFLALLPDEVLPVVLVLGAIGVVLGVITVRGVLGFLFGFVLLGLIVQASWPVASEFFGSLSLWWQLLIVLVGGVMILRLLLGLVFGSAVANHVVGFIVYDVFFRIPARMLGALVAAIFAFSQVTRDRW